MIDTTVSIAINVGFLTVYPEGAGYVGGYLVTNSWGRPLEFRLSTAIQPNRVQQILYGGTLTSYVCIDLIGKTLVGKASTTIHLLVTDSASVLPIRTQIDVPVVAAISDGGEFDTFTHSRSSVAITLPLGHAGDEAVVRGLLDRLDAALDLAEPFTRIREAMTEARKMGAISRAA